MANANLILAVARGLRPPLIQGAVSNARAVFNRLVASNQIADRRDLAIIAAQESLNSPGNIDLLV